MKLRFPCPECACPISTEDVNAPAWKCSACGVEVPSAVPADAGANLQQCRACGNHELYVRKAFPNWLGMSVVVLAGIGFLAFHWMYWFYAAWACLLGAAVLDTALYFLMGNMTVCYRCGAEHTGFAGDPSHGSFDLGVAEKYRQERLRRRELGLGSPPRSEDVP
jgi:hypothetical protein